MAEQRNKYKNFVGIYVTDEIFAFLEKRVARRHSSMSQVMREIILKEIYASQKKPDAQKEKSK